MHAGARACACGAREGWKRLVYLDASLSPSLVLVLLAKPYGPVPRITPSLRTFRGSLRSRQEALGTASPPPGSPGARNGRAADSERAIQEEAGVPNEAAPAHRKPAHTPRTAYK